LLLAACKEQPPPEPVKVAIAVTDEGYTPARIEVARGQRVTLAFTRTTTTECLEKVVIPSQSVEKALPVGQEVDVTFTPSAKGEVPFACGMDMFHGLVVVK
jgi:plastocyanin domain-containing protein